MATDVIERYRNWFAYEKDAHAKVLASLESVPAERRSSAEFCRAVSLFGHIAAARRLWLGRIGVAPPYQGQIFPDADLDAVREQLRVAENLWSEYLRTLTDADLTRVFEYQSLDAGRFRNRIEDILAQLFGHSSYHRGQIAMLVRASGGTPAVTDLIYGCRQPC
jgi:uncharacterized damage-inducible protein DinB